MDWILKIKTNENEALREIYMLCREDCLAWLQKDFGCSMDDALDIFQVSVVILYDNVKSGKLQVLSSHIKTYLMGIARNKALELHRKQKNIVPADKVPVMLQYVSDEVVDDGLEDQLHTALISLEYLGDPCKSLLQLYYYNDMNMDEVTTLMGYKNSDTTKNQKYKCLKRLQIIYSEHIVKSGRY